MYNAKSNQSKWAAGIATLIVAALVTSSSAAYEPSVTDLNAPVSWDARQVTFHISVDDRSELRHTAHRQAVEDSFATWSDGTGIELINGGQVTSRELGYATGGPNYNSVVWQHEEWDHDPAALAVTLISFNRATGELVDADIVINGVNAQWSTKGAPDAQDIQNAITHEVGHFIGLNHSDVEGATMEPSAGLGETHKQTLHEDDLAGKRFLYGGDHVPAVETEADTNGNDFDAYPSAAPAAGCTIASSNGGSGWAIVVVGLIALTLMVRRR